MNQEWVELSEEESTKRQDNQDRFEGIWCCLYWKELTLAAPCDDCGYDCYKVHRCEDKKVESSGEPDTIYKS